MKIGYITSIDIDSTKAQSNQVRSMFRAFNMVIGDNFRGYCITKNESNLNCVSNFDFDISGKFRKFITPFVFLFKVYKDDIQFIYSREIFISLFYVFLGKNVIFELHEFNNSLTQKYLLRILSYFKSFKVVTVSENGVGVLKSKYKRLKSRSLPNGVFIDDYRVLYSEKDKLNYSLFKNYKGKYTVLYTGSLFKGNDSDIIFSMAKLNEKLNFVCLGGTSLQFDVFFERYNSPCNVYHIPAIKQPDVIKYQVAADILLYPISPENKIKEYTSPLKLFEYMASRRPIVASSLGSVDEILSEDVCYLFELNNNSMSSCLSEAIKDIENNELKKTDNAFLKVETHFTWQKRVNDIIDFYNH